MTGDTVIFGQRFSKNRLLLILLAELVSNIDYFTSTLFHMGNFFDILGWGGLFSPPSFSLKLQKA